MQQVIKELLSIDSYFSFLCPSSRVYLMCTCSDIFVPAFLKLLATKDWDYYGKYKVFRDLTGSLNILCRYSSPKILPTSLIPQRELNKYLFLGIYHESIETVKNIVHLGASVIDKLNVMAFPIVQLSATDLKYTLKRYRTEGGSEMILSDWLQPRQDGTNFPVMWDKLRSWLTLQPIELASEIGNVAIVEYLISQGALTNNVIANCINYAVKGAKSELVEILVKQKLKMGVKSRYTDNQILELVHQLMQYIEAENTAENRPTSLLHALCLKKFHTGLYPSVSSATSSLASFSFSFRDAATLLVEALDQPVDNRDNNVCSPLDVVILLDWNDRGGASTQLECAKILLHIGASTGNPHGDSPIHHAVNVGSMELVQLFLSLGSAAWNILDKEEENTVLHLAILAANEKIARALLEAGASTEDKNLRDQRPMDYAAKMGHVNLMKLLNDFGSPVNKSIFHAIEHGQLEAVQFALSEGVKANEYLSSEYKTCLYKAAQYGHLSIVQLLVSKGATVNPKGQITPILVAATNNHASVVEFLLHSGANLDSHPLICTVAEKGHVELVDLFLRKGANIEAETSNKETPLLLATKHGHVELIKLLIKNGANVHAKDRWGDGPLHNIVFQRRDVAEATKLIIESGARINQTNRVGETPLHRALKVKIARILIEAGADINATTADGMTPLHKAVANYNLKLTTLFIEKGADLEINSYNNQTPLQICMNDEITEKLIECGAVTHSSDTKALAAVLADDIVRLQELFSDVDFQYDNALNLAIYHRKPAIVKLLCENPHCELDSESLLHFVQRAIDAREPAIVRILIARGVDLKESKQPHNSPILVLHTTVECNDSQTIPILQALIDGGADINTQDLNGKTALQVAKEHNNEQAIEWLLSNGANKYLRDCTGMLPLEAKETKVEA